MLSLLNLLSLPPGGGVVPDIFRELQKPTRFAWGGGVVAEFLPFTAETDPKFVSARAKCREGTTRDRYL